MTRVVITGMGAVTPLGIGVEAFWSGLTAGKSGIRTIQHFDASDLDVRIAGEVPDFVPKDFIDFKAARRMDRFSQFGVAAARQAIENAGLVITDDNRERIGIMVNTGGGGIGTIESEVTNMAKNGPKRVSPFLIPLFAPNMASCQIAISFNIHGPTVTSVAACAAGVQAFVDAVHMIQRGDADVVIAGGTEAGITPVAIAGLSNMGALSSRNDDPAGASRPFDKARDGFVFSEGSAIFVLESEEHAARRGANVICEIAGGAYTSDAFHITAPDPSGRGQAAAISGALKRAEIEPEEVDYVAAHATATGLGDIGETNTIKRVFGDHAQGPRDFRKQVDAGSPARRGRCGFGPGVHAGNPRRHYPADDQPDRSGSRMRSELHAEYGPKVGRQDRGGERVRIRRAERLGGVQGDLVVRLNPHADTTTTLVDDMSTSVAVHGAIPDQVSHTPNCDVRF